MIPNLQKTIEEYCQKRMEIQENFIAAYMLETHLNPSNIVLIEKRSEDGLTTTWWCQPKDMA